jgi:hypothetical protein
MTARWFATALAGASCLVSAPAATTTLFEEEFTCPVGGEKFEDYVVGSHTTWGQRPDGRSYGTLPIYPIVECPGNGFLLFDEEFSREDIARLEPLVASAEYQAMRRTETPHYRVAWLVEKLGRDPYQRTWELLQASWESDDDPARKARYQAAFVAAATGLERAAGEPGEWFWFNLRAANALRELGEFGSAARQLDMVDRPELMSEDEDEQAGARYLIDGLRILIAEENAFAEPANVIPPQEAVIRCTAEELSPAEETACRTPEYLEAAEEYLTYDADEAAAIEAAADAVERAADEAAAAMEAASAI